MQIIDIIIVIVAVAAIFFSSLFLWSGFRQHDTTTLSLLWFIVRHFRECDLAFNIVHVAPEEKKIYIEKHMNTYTHTEIYCWTLPKNELEFRWAWINRTHFFLLLLSVHWSNPIIMTFLIKDNATNKKNHV